MHDLPTMTKEQLDTYYFELKEQLKEWKKMMKEFTRGTVQHTLRQNQADKIVGKMEKIDRECRKRGLDPPGTNNIE